ncbi:hypothetical protein B0T22DRAFT_449032 [Podospora appendiculata]|uniref:Enoyl reductase (ER) domain-containing protein n=1 Tax=Podospora appendiculata TaxID=314037 RepID=A0AAE0XH51_9PEZI|nr:hypothetical protein B0T22DRAFT_449032 [Podospora appendiculata]
MATTIRKAVISSFSTDPSLSNVAVVSAPLPAPGKKEIQVRVLYAGFSGADVNMARGTYPMQRKAPLTSGYSLVGVVAALGANADASRSPIGSYVAAVTTYDAQAELVNVAQRLLCPVPPELTGSDSLLRQVAALSLDWATAYGMVEHTARVQAGQKVFIHGLSGAVGKGLMSLCLLRGATVYGTASVRNHASLEAAGATKVFDYRNKDWIAALRATGGVNAVFDPLGFESWDESFSVLGETGILVGYGGNQAALSADKKPRSPWPWIAKLVTRSLLPLGGRRTSFYFIKPGSAGWQADMAALMGLLREGRITVPIKAVWDLDTEGLREAHRSWGSMPGMGSLLIRVAGESA